MASKKQKTQLVSRVGFTGPKGRHIKAGQLVDAEDPIVKGRRKLFVTPAVWVEQATANPGELRINQKRDSNKPDAGVSQKAKARAAAEAAKEDK